MRLDIHWFPAALRAVGNAAVSRTACPRREAPAGTRQSRSSASAALRRRLTAAIIQRAKMNKWMNKILDAIKAIPLPARIFTFMGVSLSIGIFLLVNFRHGLSDFFMTELGRTIGDVHPSDYLFLLFFVFMGLLFSLLFSFHWYVYAWLSHYVQSNILSVTFGLIMLVGSGYIHIQSVFFAKHSTDPIAVVFIPAIIGVPTLGLYLLLGFLKKRFFKR
jgi:hypothetical protein